MSFSSIENKQMIWNILSEQCQSNFNIALNEVQNFPAYFESFVADIGKETVEETGGKQSVGETGGKQPVDETIKNQLNLQVK